MDSKIDGEVPDPRSSPSTWNLIGRYIACYALWIAICGLGLWLIFLIRTNLVEDLLFLRINPWQLRAIDRWALFVLGTFWIVGIFLAEGYLRRGLERGQLLARAGRILAVELLVVGLSFLIHLL